jgi:endonuclease YncB( thermonuclease family)
MLKRLGVFVLIVVLLGLLSVYLESRDRVVEDYERESVFVSRVIDGDTIELENGERVRLLGVNTPERGKDYYEGAKDFLMVIEDSDIEILRDWEDLDKYDRKLRYVFYDDRFLNVEILERGFGTSFMIDGLKYGEKFEKGEKFAMTNEIGLWAKSLDFCADCIWLVELNPVEEFFILENVCDFDCSLDGWSVKDNANHFFKLEFLRAGDVVRIESKSKIWNNDGDRFFMRAGDGGLVLFYEY